MTNQQTGSQFGAHEVVCMNDALMTKSANAELLSFCAQQVQDPQLKEILNRQAQAVFNHYQKGVSVLQGGAGSDGWSYSAQWNQQPQLGLRQPSQPAPNLNVSSLDDRTVATIVLTLHKHGAVAWMQCALECATPQLREYFVESALACDKMAYETWAYMNQRGHYQVPTLLNKTTQTIANSFQAAQAAQPTSAPMHPYQ